VSETFLFIDANNLIARTHHVMTELSTSEGLRTGALHGFLKGMSWCRHTTQIGLGYTVAVWDAGHSQGRLDLYPQYKRGRRLNEPKTPEDEADRTAYKQNIKWAKEALSYTRCRQLCVDGVEADDLISIFTRLVEASGGRSIIYSGDADMHQLYSRSTDIFDPKKQLLGFSDIQHKWNVPIKQLPLVKAMMGDKSDNIDGVAQIGPKRAAMLSPYFMWHFTRWGFYRCERNEVEPTDERHTKWIDHIQVTKNKKIVERNLHLMALPRTFERSYLTDQQAETSLLQWKKRRANRRKEFIALLERFELNEILNNITNW